MDKDQALKRVVENALDFLTRAIVDLNDSPKHSVIGFYSGVELFLKARLLSEHWSLVVARGQDADIGAFLSGDFSSVSLGDAAIRLEKVVQSGLTTAELETFKKIGRHRNKMIHFFHEEGTGAQREQVRISIRIEQLTAWYHLNVLLTERWSDVFHPWRRDIVSIQRRLRSHNQYLKIIYKHVRNKVTGAKRDGKIVEPCPSCAYKTEVHEPDFDEPYDSYCLVCELSQRAIRVECPDCNETVVFRQDGFCTCSHCSREFEPEDLAEILDDGAARHIAFLDGETSELANCSECDGYHVVATTEDGRHICASCLLQFESLQYCGSCGDANTGDMRNSDWNGCNHCDGRAGNYRDA